MKTVKDLFKISKGKKAIESIEVTNSRYIQIEDLRNDNQLKYAIFDQKSIYCDENDVLIAWDGANAGTIGYGLKGVIGSTIAKLTPKTKGIHNSYAGRFLQSKFQYLRENCTGATIPHISRPVLEGLNIPLPPLEEQKKIAAILDAADALRQKDKALITKYEELTQSVFLEMFGDGYKSREGWKREVLGTYIKILTDYHANGSYEILRENVELKKSHDFALMVRTTDLEKDNFEDDVISISESAYNYLKKTKIFGGEIIINKIGSAGKVYLMPKLNRPVSLGMNAFMLRFHEGVNTTFIYYLLTSRYGCEEIQKRVKGAVTKTIRKDAIREIPFIVPPLALQNKFAERIQVIEKQKQLAQQSLQKSEELFNSLLQRAFKGELIKTLEPV